jgi:photosystem II stability/assembly factor-like uncharacterized protein
VASPTTQLLEEVQALSPDEAYACGWRGTVLRYAAGRWTAYPSLMNERLFGCHFVAWYKGLVVGHHGLMWVYDAPPPPLPAGGIQALGPVRTPRARR